MNEALSPIATFGPELDVALRERLRRLAEARHRTPEVLVREAIVQYVGREEARERFRADGLAAWAEYEATGRHAAGPSVDAWLARLEAGEEADPPECQP